MSASSVEHRLSGLVSVTDVEQKAIELLPKAVRDYYQSGADDEETLRRNIRAIKRFVIRPFALRDVSHLDTSVRIELRRCSTTPLPPLSSASNASNNISSSSDFSRVFPFPIGIAPFAFQRMAHPEGEIATVQAAQETETPMICSTLSTTSMEDIAGATTGEDTVRWFQLYIYRDRAVTEQLVRRAEAAGFSAIVLTVDAPMMGRRRADERNGFVLPPHLRMANFVSLDREGGENGPAVKLSQTEAGKQGHSGFAAYTRSLFDPSLSWDHLRWLVQLTRLPVLVKGLVRGDDALRAVNSGAAGIVVSNHGGRQLDHCIATIEALPEVVAAVKRRCPVFVDGGFRSGTDVFKALALGADFVFVGRPILYGLAVGGKGGVKHVIELLRTEFVYAMKLAGCANIAQIRAAKDLVIHESKLFSKL